MKTVDHDKPEADKAFAVFFWGRVLIGLAVGVALIWGATVAVNYLGKVHDDQGQDGRSAAGYDQPAGIIQSATATHTGQAVADEHQAAGQQPVYQPETTAEIQADSTHPAVHPAPKPKAIESGAAVHSHAGIGTDMAGAGHRAMKVRGVDFVDAMIRPIEYELKERFWGWRPNDLIRVTDNVNNFQLGVLEVTRRAAMRLAERISRTGTTNVIDQNLERAMNWFMIKADNYWLPSAESRYLDGIKELRIYQQRLMTGEADFYTRADNLIPLIGAFADLMGSCDENLVKAVEKNGKPVSTFAADNYFYYAKGVASAILPILEAVAVDFEETLTTRRANDVLHHAITSCHEAARMKPLIVLESDPDSIFANHRANMAAHVSHARFYLDVLGATLSI